MNKNLEKIYQFNTGFIGDMDAVVRLFRIQNMADAVGLTYQIIDRLVAYVDELSNGKEELGELGISIEPADISSMCGNLLEAQEREDYIVLADYFEIQWLPFFLGFQEKLLEEELVDVDEKLKEGNYKSLRERDANLAETLEKVEIEKVVDAGYAVEYSSMGWRILSNLCNGKRHYYHSNYMPVRETKALVSEWYSKEKTEYVIYGFGFGYHVGHLFALNNNIKIRVYESDKNLLAMAMTFRYMSHFFENPNITIIYDPKFCRFKQELENQNENTAICIHQPSILNIKDKRWREEIDEYFLLQNGIKTQYELLMGNFEENKKYFTASFEELRDDFQGKDLYMIAAGPSLDKNIEQLRKIGSNAILLATGTVFRKLLEMKIKPDYVLITDGKPDTYNQIAGLENKKIPFIGMSTMNKEIVKNYKGKKYLMCQNGFQPAQEYAEEKGYSLVNTGGSVMTTAFDLGIQLNCKRLISVGLDLSCPEGRIHVSGVDEDKLNEAFAMQVEDIYGNLVSTTKSFNMYRKWIEERIKNVKEVELIDATEGGAKIKGMKVKRLEDVISESVE